jgi:hypothetical protein
VPEQIQLVRECGLELLSRKFGPLPPSDDELMRAFLNAGAFVFTGPEYWNPLGLGATAMFASRLVYGEDIRPQLPDPPADEYVRAVVHAPYFSYTYPPQRRDGQPLTYPLDHIDPEGACYGFDQWLIPGPDGADIPSTKLLVATVGWTASIGPGAWWMAKPIQLLPASVAPT